MPELPEVETIKNSLIKYIKGLKIIDVLINYPNIINNDETFVNKLKNQTINDIEREAKFLKFILDDYVLISHLRMEGKFYLDDELDSKHSHVIFNLSNNQKLIYHDTRKFGRFELIDKNLKDTYLKDFKNLATDPKDIDFNIFYEKIKKSIRPIKNILLDQSVIGGIGNIYVNEILFRSKIHPHKKGINITTSEAKLMLKESIKVLDEAIIKGGTTIRSYYSLGESGNFQQDLLVHGRVGEPCYNCNTLIKKDFISGRGTYYCPKCQRSHIIAITGGIASGKTTAINYLEKLNYLVVDSDLIVKDLYKDEKIIKLIGNHFDVLDNGFINVRKLSNLVFSNQEEKIKLESIIHPLVFNKIKEAINNNFYHIIFIDIPLLFETNYQEYDKSLLITTTLDNQINRLMKRNNLSKEDALLRINSQMPLIEKEKLADYVIRNDDTINKLYEEIDKFLLKLK